MTSNLKVVTPVTNYLIFDNNLKFIHMKKSNKKNYTLLVKLP